MLLGLLISIGTGKTRSGKGSHRKPGQGYYRPRVHGLEDRVTPSTLHPGVFGPALVGSLHPGALHTHHTLHSVHLLPITITGVTDQNGQLVAQGMIGSHSFTTPITLTAQQPATGTSTPILDLQLAPIHLNLLGLHVDTSAICLDVTAQSGTPLGGLLSNVANLLNQGTSLSNILSGLSTNQLSTLTNGLTSLFNGVLQDVTTIAPSTIRQDVSVTGPSCNILNLSLGPVNLNLLGLNVHLDNCANGPITVSVTAVPGAGNLLGNLLCNLSSLLNSHASLTALDNALARVAGAITSLI